MLTHAQRLQHAFSLARALFNLATLHKLSGEAHAAQKSAEAALAIVTEQGLARLLGPTTFTRGWALAAQGEHAEGIAEMRQGLAVGAPCGQGWVYGDGAGLEVHLPHCESLSPDAAYHLGPRTGMRFLEGALAAAAHDAPHRVFLVGIQGDLRIHSRKR